MILNLDAATNSISLNARFVIKMDIVNPIPAKQAVPKRKCQFNPLDSIPTPNFTAKYEKKKMPIGLPKTKPIIIPNELLEIRLLNISSGITTIVLASTKRGRIKNATGLCNLF